MRYWLLHGHWRVMMIFRLLSATGAVWWLDQTGMKSFLAQMVGSSAMAVPQMRIRPRSTVDSAWPARIVLAGPCLPIGRSTMANRTKVLGRTVVELDPKVRLALVKHCEVFCRPITWVVNQAVKEFLEKQERSK